MSTTAVIAIVVAVVVVLAAIAFFTLARRSDVRGAGALSGRNRADATGRRACRPPVSSPPPQRGRRRGRRRRSPAPAPPLVRIEPTPSSRRGRHPTPRRSASRAAVLQPRHRRADERRPRHVRRGGLRRVPLADGHRRLRRPGRRRQARDDQGRHQAGRRLLLRPRGPLVDHRVPGRGAARGRTGLRRAAPRRHAAGHHHPQTRSARTSAAACRSAPPASGSSASATARSTTASARRRPARPRAAWTASPPRSPPTATSRSTPASSSPARPIGTNTTGQEAEGPHCIGRRRALMTAVLATTTTAIAVIGLVIITVGWIVYGIFNVVGRAQGGRLGDRARRQPQAVLRRRDARGSAARARAVASACSCWSSSSSPFRSTGCSSRAVRPGPRRAGRSGSPAGVRELFAPTADGGVQLRRLPRRHGRRRR